MLTRSFVGSSASDVAMPSGSFKSGLWLPAVLGEPRMAHVELKESRQECQSDSACIATRDGQCSEQALCRTQLISLSRFAPGCVGRDGLGAGYSPRRGLVLPYKGYERSV